ncbi:hypothetical protein B0A48_18170 [Cryoendolithus antarcticus]|uniref:F-box domain-containing protein n=1 Tax=Cryoendolithus antarcticus TaxID=1507870 RepID=A0A1V8S9P6_9PEZI|nr:hypothetical protein B0A48_18170 [Cryoendolithus antarcticus]
MAAIAVLDLPELLESVLIELDMKTLLLSQRVSKQWKASIDCSANLQDKLFFKLKDHRDEDGVDAINTLLVKYSGRAPFFSSHHVPRTAPQSSLFDSLLEPVNYVFAFDLTVMSADASARRMTLSWCKREKYPVAGTRFMMAVGEQDANGEGAGWIEAVDGWYSAGKRYFTGKMGRAVAVGLMQQMRS